MTSDKIVIRDLRVKGVVGVEDHERRERQEIVVQMEVERDCSPAAASDDLEDALDYRALVRRVGEYVESSSHYLVEALAESISRIALEEFGADAVRVRVEKPQALAWVGAVGVEIERRRPRRSVHEGPSMKVRP